MPASLETPTSQRESGFSLMGIAVMAGNGRRAQLFCRGPRLDPEPDSRRAPMTWPTVPPPASLVAALRRREQPDAWAAANCWPQHAPRLTACLGTHVTQQRPSPSCSPPLPATPIGGRIRGSMLDARSCGVDGLRWLRPRSCVA